VAKGKKKSGARSKVGNISQWGLVDVGEKTYALALFRNKKRCTFRAYEFDKDGILHVQPISQWLIITSSFGEGGGRVYNCMAECIANGFYDVYGLRDSEVNVVDIVDKIGPITIYGYCA